MDCIGGNNVNGAKKDVVVMMCNYGFRDMTVNLIKSIGQTQLNESNQSKVDIPKGVTNIRDWERDYLLFALDERAHQYFTSNNIPTVNFTRSIINICFKHHRKLIKFDSKRGYSVCSQCIKEEQETQGGGKEGGKEEEIVIDGSYIRTQYNKIKNDNIQMIVESDHPENQNQSINDGVYGEETESYGGVGFRAICNEKPLVVLDILKRGCNVLWTDTDIVWMGDPMKHIRQLDRQFNHQVDLFVQQDDDDICAGFYYIKSNEKTISYMETVIAFLNPVVDDQIAMRLFLKSMALNITSTNQLNNNNNNNNNNNDNRIKVYKLDRNIFPNGTAYFNLKLPFRVNVNPIIIHNNCIIGHRSKKSRFIEYNLWFVKDFEVEENNVNNNNDNNTITTTTKESNKSTFKAHFDIVTAITSINNILISTSIDKSIKFWDLNSCKVLKSKYIHKRGAVWGLIAMKEEEQKFKVITASHDKTIQVWDDQLNSLQSYSGHFEAINTIKLISIQQQRLLVSGSDDHSIRVYSLDDSNYKRVYVGHSGWVSSLDYNKTNNLLYSSSSDGTIREWDFTSGRCINIISANQGWVRSIVYHQDWNVIISSGTDGSIKLWSMEPSTSAESIPITTFYPSGNHTPISTILFYQPLSLLIIAFEDGNLKSYEISKLSTDSSTATTTTQSTSEKILDDNNSNNFDKDIYHFKLIKEYQGHYPNSINCMHIVEEPNNNNNSINDTTNSNQQPMVVTGGFDKLIKSWSL